MANSENCSFYRSEIFPAAELREIHKLFSNGVNVNRDFNNQLDGLQAGRRSAKARRGRVNIKSVT